MGPLVLQRKDKEEMPQKRSSWLLIIDIIDRPGHALANIALYPRWRWLLPALLAVIALVVSTVLTAPLLVERSAQMMAEVLRNIPSEQASMVRQQMERFNTPTLIVAQTVAGGVLALLVTWVVRAAILYFSSLIAGGEVSFNGIFVALPWLDIPRVLEVVLQTVYTLVTGRLITNYGLSYLVSSGRLMADARDPAYVALSQVTLFNLWHLVLVYILYRAVAKLGSGTSFLLTVLYFGLLLGGQLALVAVSRLLSPTL
jgi:Yip1 domain